MLNFVTLAEGQPAVSIRAIRPTEGLEAIASRRLPQRQELWTDGPAQLCQALDIDRRLNGLDLCDPHSELWVEAGCHSPMKA